MPVSLKKALFSGVALAGLAGLYISSLERSQTPLPPVATEPRSIAADLPKPVPESPDLIDGRTPDVASAKDPGRVEPPAAPGTALLWGTLHTESGEVVSGEQVTLYSASLNEKHRTISNDHGEFVIRGITPANDYSVSVSPRGMFARYQHDLSIGQNQTDINIKLRSLTTSGMTGWVVDVNGNPVSGLDLVIKNPARARWLATVTTDVGGRFEVGRVPEGKLEVSSRTLQTGQLLKITGLELVAGAIPVKLVVDVGRHLISGRVYDTLGSPVAGAIVLLTWTHSEAAVRSIATRRTITDPSGAFVIGGLGEGPHDLIISFVQEASQRRKINVGRDNLPIDIVLNLDD